MNDARNTFYCATLQGNWSEVAIHVYINGHRYELNRASTNIVKDQTYWIRFRRNKGLFVKIWKVGTPEPVSWTVTSGFWDGASPGPGNGSPGMFSRGTRDAYTYRVHDYYYYSLEDTYKTGVIRESFTRRVDNAWGVSDTGHVWEAMGNFDPAAYKEKWSCAVETGSGGHGWISTTDTGEYTMIAGPSRQGDVENTGQFLIGGGDGVGRVRVGIRGSKVLSGGKYYATGYMMQVSEGSNSAVLYKRTAVGNYTAITSGTLPFTVAINVKYNVKLQAKGTTIKGKVWRDGTAEPTTWAFTATDSSISAGTLWYSVNSSGSVFRKYYFYRMEYDTPDPDAPADPKNYTTTDRLHLQASQDNSMTVYAYYKDDLNNSSSISVQYRQVGTTAWRTYSGTYTPNRTAKYIAFTLTGLVPGTNYEIRATFQDTNGVKGTNPIVSTFSTSASGIQTGTLKIEKVEPNAITISAGYSLDIDGSSTAALASRKSSQETNIIDDSFVDAKEDDLLQNLPSNLGGGWVRHPKTTPNVQSIYTINEFYARTSTAADKLLYYHDKASPSAEYTVNASLYAASLNGNTGVAARIVSNVETFYGAGFDGPNSQWELFKVVDGVKTVLATAPFEGSTGTLYRVTLVVKNALKSLYIQDELVATSEDNSITGTGYAGYYSTGVESGTRSNQFTLRGFSATYRSPSGSWVNHGNMSPNRAAKRFTGVASGLEADTVYEFRVTFSDTVITGTNPVTTTAMTPGRSSALRMVGAITAPTSAVVSVTYDYDTNNNSYIEAQYKATTSSMWETLSYQKVRAYRGAKRFDLTLSNLVSSTTYEVRVTIVDPDGLMEGTPATLVGLFTTKGLVQAGTPQGKQYVWKIYDRKDRYLATIHDAPEPSYTLYENGGVTDLEFSLYRKFNEMQASKLIDFQHRIDIWAIAPYSDGMGPNLITDPDCDPAIRGWVTGQPASNHWGVNSSYVNGAGPDGSSALRIIAPDSRRWPTPSNPILVDEEVPLVVTCSAKATGSKLRLYVQSFNQNDQTIDTSDDIAETVGPDWQKLKIEYIPPVGTTYIRVIIENDSKGTMYADKFDVKAKEQLLYRGRIESFTPKIDENGETVSIQVLGLASLLSDDYIEHLQFVEVQPQEDVVANRKNYGAADPADMMKILIDEARRSNPMFTLYYTTESIKYTGNLMQYTFRDQQVRNCMDKIRTLCPAGWHYFIEPDGLVVLRGPDDAPTHTLRIGVEISKFEVEKSIRNLKNYIRVKGRQDEDKSEADGHGSISHISFDQQSIDRYGKRVLFIRDSQITDPETARLVADGRLDENNREEQRVVCDIPDEKQLKALTGSLKGYNIEAFRPGDNVSIIDPLAGPRFSYWDQFRWDDDPWDHTDVFRPIQDAVPIKTIKYKGNMIELELSEKPPSQVGDFSKLYQWMSKKDTQ